MKKFFGNRWTKRALLFSLVVSMMVCTAFAVGEDTTGTTIDVSAITSAFSSGFQSMVTNSISMISAMVPIGLTLAGTIFLVKKAMSWFKGIAK